MATNQPDGNSSMERSDAPRPTRTRLIVALTLLAFVGGLGAMAWVMTHWESLRFDGADNDPAALAATANGALNGNSSDATQDMPFGPRSRRSQNLVLSADQQGARVLDLEQRLARVSIAAGAASGYASRAEAMMVAFAARRALDAGSPLGYVEGQLRLLFGEAQPKAVATIVNAAAAPVTLSKLREGLEIIGTAVGRGGPEQGWWSSAKRELSDLVIIRRAGVPSPEPRQRIARARLNVESGQIDAAIAEIAALQQQPETTAWLEQARRYNEAHRALDIVESAAILEPRTAPTIGPVARPATPGRPAAR